MPAERDRGGAWTAGIPACVVLVLATSCAPPFAIRRNLEGAQRAATTNVISTGGLTRRSQNLLYERDLRERFREDPAGALAQLHADLVADRLDARELGPLAELTFHYARDRGGSPYYLAAALYAWAYLFPDDPKDRPDRLDPSVRLATEIYNRGLSKGLRLDGMVDLRPARRPLPFGTLDVHVDEGTLVWSGHQLYDFYPLIDIEVSGFPTYYRWPGIGASLAAKVVPTANDADLLARRIRVPVTAVLAPADLTQGLRSGAVRSTLTAYPGYGDQKIRVGDVEVALEAEPTATLGLGLSETAIWKAELSVFLGGGTLVTKQTQLVSTRPYRRGLIPVVLVHGTGSSAIRWAELYNELDNDPVLHERYQFWFFSYDSGNPIIYSSSLLRDALEQAVAKLDPEGSDPALRRMVVMGHSQGGLLTKMTAVESGDAFWRNLSSKRFDEVQLGAETRALFQRVMFVHPLPFVKRVVFVATPHRGSYVAGSWLAHQGARLISMPLTVTKVLADAVTLDDEAFAIAKARGAPTAVDNMTPGNAFVKALSALPIAPGVAANSIIPVDGDPPYSGKNDGVVEYDSAHIDGVESEVVVRSRHSCQSHPKTVEEVRRILLKHLSTP